MARCASPSLVPRPLPTPGDEARASTGPTHISIISINMAEREKEVTTQLFTILEEARSAGISEDRIRECLKSTSEVDEDPVKKGCRLLNCLVFQIYPLFFLVALFGYPIFKLIQGSPCLVTEVTPLGEAMIPVMNCK